MFILNALGVFLWGELNSLRWKTFKTKTKYTFIEKYWKLRPFNVLKWTWSWGRLGPLSMITGFKKKKSPNKNTDHRFIVIEIKPSFYQINCERRVYLQTTVSWHYWLCLWLLSMVYQTNRHLLHSITSHQVQ